MKANKTAGFVGTVPECSSFWYNAHMRKNRVVEQNRCYHLVSRLAHRALKFGGLQAANRKDRASMTRKTYCGNQV